jgi:nitroimidazol reductase NimA-like FMN-containing flavoprotein (pyridoxamine 5'-phosphate oxidase superfamily)
MSAARSYEQLPQTTPTRSRERMSYDEHLVHAVLDEALICHLGFVAEGKPVVLPTIHARIGSTVYLHGSTGSRPLLMALRDGALDVCLTATIVDGLVLARSAFHHSMNYRSVVAHGQAVVVTDQAEKRAALDAVVEHVLAGRSADSRPGSARELAATSVLRLDLHAVAVKLRTGDPNDDEEDLALPHWAGVLPVLTTTGTPRQAADQGGRAVPAYVLSPRPSARPPD